MLLKGWIYIFQALPEGPYYEGEFMGILSNGLFIWRPLPFACADRCPHFTVHVYSVFPVLERTANTTEDDYWNALDAE